MHFSILSLHCSTELIHLNNIRQPSLNYKCAPFFFVQLGHLFGQVTLPDLLFFFCWKNKRKRKRFIFWNIYFKVWIFLCSKKYIPISYLEYPVFWPNYGKYTYISKFVFLCDTANTLTCFERSFFYTKNIGILKMCFRMDFLNKKKQIGFLVFLDFTTCL
jgi:hypothetical protein